jgi:hypothetical protein
VRSIKLTPLALPRDRRRLVFAPPNHHHALSDGEGDATLVCGGAACAFVFGRAVAVRSVRDFAFRCPDCGTESELPRTPRRQLSPVTTSVPTMP